MEFMYVAYSWMAVSAAGLAGFWLHLHYRRRDRMLSRGADMERLEAVVQALQSDVDGLAAEMHERVSQIHERLDFTERLLTNQPEGPRRALPEPSRIPTPV